MVTFGELLVYNMLMLDYHKSLSIKYIRWF